MKHDEHLTWHYYPLHLTRKEIIDPMLVIDEFFGYTWLNVHLKILKKWRKKILGDSYFKGRNGSPTTLLHIYELNIRLIETAFILNSSPQFHEHFKVHSDVCEKQIKAEREQWRNYPVRLNSKQLSNPIKVIKNLCDAYTMPQYRDHLYEWLHYGLSVSACDEFIEAVDLIQIYENLQLLFEACWIMHMRHKSPVSLDDEAHAPAPNDEQQSPKESHTI
jgi:hypothetical protein